MVATMNRQRLRKKLKLEPTREKSSGDGEYTQIPKQDTDFQVINSEGNALLTDDGMIMTRINDDGSTSNYFDKRKLKIAPRSTLQFKVGPPFEPHKKYGNIFDKRTEKLVQFKVVPRIDRGFDHIDEEWVGYKRNYFSLVSSFEIQDYKLEDFLDGSYKLEMDGHYHNVNYFAINIKARTADELSEINLVQHTAKRDKGPQFSPTMCPLIPSVLPQHQIIREVSNVRNVQKMKKYDSTFYFHRDQKLSQFQPGSLLFSYPDDCIQKVARYERVQFSSSINVKKPDQQNKYFKLHVLFGVVITATAYEVSQFPCSYDKITTADDTECYFIHLQELITPPLIIRGRSPSNYTSSKQLTLTQSQLNGKPHNQKLIQLPQSIQLQGKENLPNFHLNSSSKRKSSNASNTSNTSDTSATSKKWNKVEHSSKSRKKIKSKLNEAKQVDSRSETDIKEPRMLSVSTPYIADIDLRRPIKRDAQVVNGPYISIIECPSTEKPLLPDSKRSPHRVQTIEHIENDLYSNTYTRQVPTLQNEQMHKIPSMFEYDPLNLEQVAVNLKDIELKPIYSISKTRVFIVDPVKVKDTRNATTTIPSMTSIRPPDSLLGNNKMQRPRSIATAYYSRASENTSFDDSTVSNLSYPVVVNNSKPGTAHLLFSRVSSKAEGNKLSSRESNYLANISNYEMFTSLESRQKLQQFIKSGKQNYKADHLPSEIISAGCFLEDDSFYIH
ncbi:hypothetical protein NCAS_0B07070 [Naumovozyma castellii]|uniref:NDT80 domain-containing protein n=1 Tax=Naumovozyma castellii TaxID=27288 RepID=G0VA61_NAUCA|nr:hypothetical protein NCAS_0B07070 [Naumovozyma castellii CBS 4309]CCC68791.1 hypothetical protein NCAS_0B07070 [Naumovozyma castellii CBS 4309]